MKDRLNQELEVNDLVLFAHPKTSILVRGIVIKVNQKTVKIGVVPGSPYESEDGMNCQNQLYDIGVNGGDWHGNYWRSTIGFNRRFNEVVKVGHRNTDCNLENSCEYVVDNAMDINCGDKNIWLDVKCNR